MPRPPRIMLFIGGALSAAMGAYHFALPVQFGWIQAMKGAPDSLRWALIALNTFFSLLLLLDGVMVVMLAITRRGATAPGVWIIASTAIFWAVNFAYQFACPMPLPDSLEWLRLAFRGFALLVFLLLATPLAILAGKTLRAPRAGAVA